MDTSSWESLSLAIAAFKTEHYNQIIILYRAYSTIPFSLAKVRMVSSAASGGYSRFLAIS